MALKGKVKAKEHENLSEANIKKVIELLSSEKPITKKEACEILNISYNTTRLGKIIQEFKEGAAELQRRRAANRGKPASAHEIQLCIEGYLDGEALADIAKRIFRSSGFVKEVVERVGVPQKVVGSDYRYPGIIPDQCAREEFERGQIVWHARRHCMAIVLEEKSNVKDTTSKYYQVYVIEPMEEIAGPHYSFFPKNLEYGGFYDGAFAYDLGSLDHLKEYGVDVYRPYRSCFKNWLQGR